MGLEMAEFPTLRVNEASAGSELGDSRVNLAYLQLRGSEIRPFCANLPLSDAAQVHISTVPLTTLE
jgi:hypothetical protein